jgi:hypothetical protein
MTALELYAAAQIFFPPPPMPSAGAGEIHNFPNCSGVYFLYQENRLLYVGESVSLRKRLAHHEHRGRFDSVGWLNCDPAQRKRLEAFYIGVLNPPLNHQSTALVTTTRVASRRLRQQGSVARRLLRFIQLHPGCTKTQVTRSVRRSANKASLVLDRMREWRLIRMESIETGGRRKTLFFPASS